MRLVLRVVLESPLTLGLVTPIDPSVDAPGDDNVELELLVPLIEDGLVLNRPPVDDGELSDDPNGLLVDNPVPVLDDAPGRMIALLYAASVGLFNASGLSGAIGAMSGVDGVVTLVVAGVRSPLRVVLEDVPALGLQAPIVPVGLDPVCPAALWPDALEP